MNPWRCGIERRGRVGFENQIVIAVRSHAGYVCVHFVVVGVYVHVFCVCLCGCKWPKGLNDFNFTIKLC